MKTFTKALLATSAAIALSATAGAANAVTYISFDGVNPTAGGTFADNNAAFALILNAAACSAVGNPCGGFDSLSIGGNPVEGDVLLHSQTVEANASGAASVDIFVTRTDLTGDYDRFFSDFSGTFSRTSGSAPFTVRYRSYVDQSNGLFSTANLLRDATVTGTGGTSNPGSYGSDGPLVFVGNPTGPFAVTTRFTISTTGSASLQPDITISGAVPEPATWALMIGGFGGAGAMLRRRRKSAIAA